MSLVNDLVARLLEAIAAQEASAEKDSSSTHTRYRIGGTYGGHRRVDKERMQRILRRCAADRIIVQQHMPAPSLDDDAPDCGVCIRPGYIGTEFCCDWPRVPWPCPTMNALAEGYGILSSPEQEEGK